MMTPTSKETLKYNGNKLEVPHFELYSDASFAPTGRKSPLGVLVEMNGVVVAWRASRMQLIAQSVAEGELGAILEAWLLGSGLREVFCSVGCTMASLVARTDNEAARLLSRDGSSWRTRHFAVKAEVETASGTRVVDSRTCGRS
eukprot:1778922-Amphidinium_carterae.1